MAFYHDLETPSWWLANIAKYPNWRPGGVFCIATGPNDSVHPGAAWLYTAINLQSGHGAVFSNIFVIAPPGIHHLNYKERLDSAFRSQFAENSESGELKSFLQKNDWFIPESNGSALLERVERMPDGSAIAVCAAQRIRFHDLISRGDRFSTTHTGHQIYHSSAEDRAGPHLHQLLTGLLDLSVRKNLAVVVFVENLLFEVKTIPTYLANHPSLAVLSADFGAEQQSNYESKLRALQMGRESSVESALKFLTETISDTLERAHAVSVLYADQGLWAEAWKALEPHLEPLLGLGDVQTCLNIAQTAEACGEAAPAERFASAAIDAGLDTVESFNSAAQITASLKSDSLLNRIILQMKAAYPDHPATLKWEYRSLFGEKRYAEAAEIADKIGDKFNSAWCHLLSEDTPTLETFVSIGADCGREVEALCRCTRYSLDAGDTDGARKFFNRIPNTSEYSEVAAELGFEILVKEASFIRDDSHLENLGNQMSTTACYLADHPTDRDLRARVMDWLNRPMHEGVPLALLAQTFFYEFHQASAYYKPENIADGTNPLEFEEIERCTDAARKFMQEVSLDSTFTLFGQPSIEVNYGNVGDEVLAGLGVLVRGWTDDPTPNVKGIAATIHCIYLACYARRQGAWDFVAATQLVSALSMRGSVSDALNLCETLSLCVGENQIEPKNMRLAHSWACMAEVYQRAFQPMSALLYLLLSFAALRRNFTEQHVILLRHKVRLATRVLRDLRLLQAVRPLLEFENGLSSAFPASKHERKQLELMTLSCSLYQVDATTPQPIIAALVAKAEQMLASDDESEWEPPVSAGITLMNILRSQALPTPESLKMLIAKRLPRCSATWRYLFHCLSIESPSFSDIQCALNVLFARDSPDNEGFQLLVLSGLLRRGLVTATKTQDPYLFTYATGWLSQPALAGSRAERELNTGQSHVELSSPAELTKFTARQLQDHFLAFERQKSRLRARLPIAGELPFSAAAYVAVPNEALCLVALDSTQHLTTLVIYRDKFLGPTRVGKDSWDQGQFQLWRSKYPKGYSWDRKYSDLGPYDIPDLEDVISSLRLLNPNLPRDASAVTILPEANIFGFTFYLSHLTHQTGSAQVVSTAPSLTWLATVRRLSPPFFSVSAWLGHPTESDQAVMRPRGELMPHLLKARARILTSRTPRGIGSSGVTIILSHGSEDHFGGFSGLDDVGQFTNEDLASYLSESVCVIFFVCNAGRNDVKVFNSETFGVIGQLLRRGIRAVIAPPAPLRNDLPARWLPRFLEALQAGSTVGEAYQAGCDSIRAEFDHPCAWGALQLFGDASLRFRL